MDVFEVFPEAVLHDVWEMGRNVKDTVLGKYFCGEGAVAVIVDEATSVATNRTPEITDSDLLIYARPQDLPRGDAGTLAAEYMWHDTKNDRYYDIVEVGMGKNQSNGQVEHVEFRVRLTEVANEC